MTNVDGIKKSNLFVSDLLVFFSFRSFPHFLKQMVAAHFGISMCDAKTRTKNE